MAVAPPEIYSFIRKCIQLSHYGVESDLSLILTGTDVSIRCVSIMVKYNNLILTIYLLVLNLVSKPSRMFSRKCYQARRESHMVTAMTNERNCEDEANN